MGGQIRRSVSHELVLAVQRAGVSTGAAGFEHIRCQPVSIEGLLESRHDGRLQFMSVDVDGLDDIAVVCRRVGLTYRLWCRPTDDEGASVEVWWPGASIDRLEAFYDASFERHLEEVRLEPLGPPVFAALRSRGLPVAVVTITHRKMARSLLDRAGLAPDELVCGTDVPRSKPAPDMILEACRRLGTTPARSLVVGDSHYDREAARAAGAPFAGLGIAGDWSLARLDQVLDALDGRASGSIGGTP